ncbi:MAG TPA: urea amidolyase, partial [Beijerinckiaceae bacterium]
AVAPGAVQIPGDGQPIILGVDAQTTGGYPKIAAVISADLPLLARLPAGAAVTFEVVSYAQAVQARREQAEWIARLPQTIRDAPRAEALADLLFNANLIGGVVDAWAVEGCNG